MDIGLDLDHLAATLAERGVAAVEPALARVARAAAAAGACPVVIAVLADPTEPEVARIRAFAKAARSLSRTEEAVAPVEAGVLRTVTPTAA